MGAAKKSSGSMYVCGYVNAKNSFGGYTGAKPFYGLLSPDLLVFSVVDIGSDDISVSVTRQMCQMSGVIF